MLSVCINVIVYFHKGIFILFCHNLDYLFFKGGVSLVWDMILKCYYGYMFYLIFVGLLYSVLMITNPSVKICPSNVALKHDLQSGLTGVCALYCINWFASCENKSSK